MSKHPLTMLADLGSAMKATDRRWQLLLRLQKAFIVLCAVAIVTALSLKYMGARPMIVIYLGIFGGFMGLGGVLAGRAVEPILAKAESYRNELKQYIAIIDRIEKEELTRIPLTIGFANLSGADLAGIAAEDAATLSPIFARSRIVPDNQIPKAEVLFLYAHLNEDGTIKGQDSSGIRQVAQLTNAAIIILASPNSPEAIQKAAGLPGPKTSNIIFTLDRNGSGFARYFRELFKSMRTGKDMLSAWVELSPQGPNIQPSYAPQTILLAEGGKLAFPSMEKVS